MICECKPCVRTVWASSPFPGLYEVNPKTPLCAKLVNGEHNSNLILIHHLNEVTLPFIKALSSSYSIKRIIGIPYSSINSIVKKLEKDFEVIIPSNLEDIVGLVRETVESANNNIIIEEIGGYTSDIAEYLDKTEHVKGIVEDTSQGHWRWQNINLKRLPVMSVAFSRIKRIEDNFVARSIIDGLEHFLHNHNLPLIKDQKILILGFGNIGEQVAKYLKPLCKDLIVYDTDPIKSFKAGLDYKVSSDFSAVSIVLGLTGNTQHSVKVGDIEKFGLETILVSGSSKRVEFDLDGFRREASKIDVFGDVWTFYFGGKIVRVANQGEPINLRYSIIPSKILDLVCGSLTYCINKLDNGDGEPGLQEISEPEQKEILKTYKQIYGLK